MAYRHTIDATTHVFADLRDLMAKATPPRSGDRLAGIAADSAEEMIAARMALADVPLTRFLQETVIAYEDGALNLYSERKAFRPMIFLPAGRFRSQILQSELDCIADSSKRLRADYWLVSEDDFSFEWQTAATRGLAREKEALSGYPVVFQSKGEDVRIYQLGSNAVSGSEPSAEPSH